MKMTKTSGGITAVVLGGFTLMTVHTASAAVMYHDLGATTTFESTGNITTHQSGAANVSSAAADTSAKNLINYATGATTGVQFSISGAALDSRNGGQFAPPSAATPAAALFNVAGLDLTNGSMITNATMTLTLTGLNPLLTYDLALYGNRVFATDGLERFTLGGATAATNSTSTTSASFIDSTFESRMDTRPNTDDVVRWTNINPGIDGIITVTVDPTIINPGTNIAYLSAMRLESIPEPSVAVLGGLGLLALLRRRR